MDTMIIDVQTNEVIVRPLTQEELDQVTLDQQQQIVNG
jgi:hypothetical protein